MRRPLRTLKDLEYTRQALAWKYASTKPRSFKDAPEPLTNYLDVSGIQGYYAPCRTATVQYVLCWSSNKWSCCSRKSGNTAEKHPCMRLQYANSLVQCLQKSNMASCTLIKVTGSLCADTRTVYLIKCYFIVKPCNPTWTEDCIELDTNRIERARRSVFVNTDDRSEVIRCCIPKRGVKMVVTHTQGSFFRGVLNVAT